MAWHRHAGTVAAGGKGSRGLSEEEKQLQYYCISLSRSRWGPGRREQPSVNPREVPGGHGMSSVTTWSSSKRSQNRYTWRSRLLSKVLCSLQQTWERLGTARAEWGRWGVAPPMARELDNVILGKPELLPDFTVHTHQNHQILQTSSLFQTAQTHCLVISVPTV